METKASGNWQIEVIAAAHLTTNAMSPIGPEPKIGDRQLLGEKQTLPVAP